LFSLDRDGYGKRIAGKIGRMVWAPGLGPIVMLDSSPEFWRDVPNLKLFDRRARLTSNGRSRINGSSWSKGGNAGWKKLAPVFSDCKTAVFVGK
jgi:hypothetical protein